MSTPSVRRISFRDFRRDNRTYTRFDALELALRRGLRIDAYATDAAPAREDLDFDTALDYAMEDASLLTVVYVPPEFGDAWETPQNIGGGDWAAYVRDSGVGVMWTEFGSASVVQDDGGTWASVVRTFSDVRDAVAYAERVAGV